MPSKLRKKLAKITIVVSRMDKNGQWRNSKPCHECIKTLKMYGFKNVCYTTGDENEPFVVESIKTIENDHRSKLQRQMTRDGKFMEK